MNAPNEESWHEPAGGHRIGDDDRAVQQHAEAGAVRVAYMDEGEGPLVVALPSLGRGAEDFDLATRMLVADGFRVVRPQPRGIGGSTGPLSGISLADLAADVAAVLEQVGPAVVAGHAFDNFVGRMLAVQRPELVTGVALLAASAGKKPDGSPPFGADILESILKSGDLDLSDAERLVHLRQAFFASSNDPTPWLQGWYPEVKSAQVTASNATPVDAWFAAGRAPILHVQADCDTVAPPGQGHYLRQCLGDRVTLATVEGAGHALLPERPRETVQALARWVRALHQ